MVDATPSLLQLYGVSQKRQGALTDVHSFWTEIEERVSRIRKMVWLSTAAAPHAVNADKQ